MFKTDVQAYFAIVLISLIVNSLYLVYLFKNHFNGIEFVLKVILVTFEAMFIISFICHLVWIVNKKHYNDWQLSMNVVEIFDQIVSQIFLILLIRVLYRLKRVQL